MFKKILDIKKIPEPFESDQSESENSDSSAATIISLEKRHLGALARSGWIPSFGPSRNRFSRSGRTENMEQNVIENCFLCLSIVPCFLSCYFRDCTSS